MKNRFISLLLCAIFAGQALAAASVQNQAPSQGQAQTEGQKQAASFSQIYAALCLKNLSNLDALRETLKPAPALPSEKAAYFLAGQAGTAWPVPDKNGIFVLALPEKKNFCALHGRRADSVAVEQQFVRLVGQAPAPFTAKQVRNEQKQTAANGLTKTLAYEWSAPNVPRKMLFTLTTAASETAQLQVLGSAAMVAK